VGDFLLGRAQTAHIRTPSSTVRRIDNMAAVACMQKIYLPNTVNRNTGASYNCK
jgi:hypothetical protein